MTAVNKLSELEHSFHQPLAVVALTQNNHNWFMHQTKSSWQHQAQNFTVLTSHKYKWYC